VVSPEVESDGPEEPASEEESELEAALEEGSEERFEAVSEEVEESSLCGLALDPFPALEEREPNWHEAKRIKRDKPKMSFWPLRFIAGYFTKWPSGFQLNFSLASIFSSFSMDRNSLNIQAFQFWAAPPAQKKVTDFSKNAIIVDV
jgi:hypothetical protein